jgi:hypothetical protein
MDNNKPAILHSEVISFNPGINKFKIIVEESLDEKEKTSKEINNSLFTIKTANAWIDEAKTKPIPKMLFSELWFENELCILFSDTNLGKTILAVQIADSISKGIPIKSFKMQAEKQQVLYFDFELSSKQFENRYSNNFTNHFVFDNNFLRLEINSDSTVLEHLQGELEDHIVSEIEKTCNSTQAKILIVDNITYLKNDNEKARHALTLMKKLKLLKSKYGLSILALAHTPKRDLSKPITRNDLQGSKMLINFCDSAFAIGESTQDKDIRYIKQIKERQTEKVYGSDNVCVCRLEKPDNFLMYEYKETGYEGHHLREFTPKERDELDDKIMELYRANSNQSYNDIAKRLNTNKMHVKRVIDRNKP